MTVAVNAKASLDAKMVSQTIERHLDTIKDTIREAAESGEQIVVRLPLDDGRTAHISITSEVEIG